MKVAAQQHPLLLILAEEPLRDLDAEQTAALTELLRTHLPAQLQQARPQHPVHLLVAVEHSGQRTPDGDDPLVAALDDALHGAAGLTFEPLFELRYPDAWDEIRGQIRRELGGRVPDIEAACRTIHAQITADPGRTYRALAHALAKILETMPEAP